MRRTLATLTVVVTLAATFLAAMGPARAASTFVVNLTGDASDVTPLDGACDVNFFLKGSQCTLRAAIQQANASFGADSILFSIGSGAQTISPSSALPTISGAVTIDATTQPGFSGTPLITLSGASAGSGVTGLTIGAGGTIVKGLLIDAFSKDGISITGGGGDTISGNWIGIDALSNDVGNAGDGIRIGGSGANTIGGTTSAARNVISGNDANGIEIVLGSAGNTVEGNYVGTSAGGTVAVGNSFRGVLVLQGPATIGGVTASAANIISGNGSDGVLIDGTPAANVLVEGNLIGTDVSGQGALGNGAIGVAIFNGPGNTVGVGGGTAGGACQAIGCNVISGNKGPGVEVVESSPALAASNVIEGNFIGTSVGGSSAIPNVRGVHVEAAGATVGGSGIGDGNVISGNTGAGVSVDVAGTHILGNLIGTNSVGTSAVANGIGVDLEVGPNTVGGTTGTTPGGSCTGACNLISGNSGGAVHVGLAATGVEVLGNMIGLDRGGSVAVPNGSGVDIQGSSDTVGGTSAAAGNVISGNFGTGVVIDGVPPNPLPTSNLVQGNRIGTTAAGTAAVPNLQGVGIFDATANTIGGATGTTPGGSCTGACNVISGNDARGMDISNADTTGNVVSGNFIGLDSTGTARLGNGGSGGGPGIRVETQASGTVIGGTKTAARNVISGNSGEGIDLEGAIKTKVQGNYIGTDTTGTADLGNGEVLGIHEPGVTVFGGSGNAVGGMAGARNLISGNGEAGVVIDGAAKSTKVQHNLIGTRANGTGSLGNTGDGVDIVSGTKSTVGGTTTGLGNTIRFNGGVGVTVDAGKSNAIRGNSISGSGGLGIDLDPPGVNPNDAKDPDVGANLGQNYPVITSASSSGGSTMIQGTFNSTPSTSGFTLELFSSPSCDGSGFGEGKTFLGLLAAVATNANGNASWSVTLAVTVAPGSAVTATTTSSTGDTSEFSACTTSK